MPIIVKIFTKQGGRSTLFQTRQFETLPVTLGRDATCSVALEDPLRHISRTHVELRNEDGGCWLSVVSKVNPVIVKGHRYGPGSRVQLASGDSFELAEFEVQVVFVEIRRPQGAAEKSLIEMLAADEPSAPAIEDIPPPEPGIFDEPTYIRSATGTPKAVPESVSQDAVRVFLEGAGMPYKDLPAAESEKLLRECGAMLRAAVEGLMTLLIARSEMRKEFEAKERTMAPARDNNPLKLMGEPQEAMEFLFDPAMRNEGFLDPLRAIGDAGEDLRVHELALMAGMRATILGAVRRFDPQVLEKALDKSAGGFSFGGRKARLWQLFLEHQQKLAQDAQADFNKVFGADFMAAYEAELRRLKIGH